MSEAKERKTTPEGLILVHTPDEVPTFASEKEEADFWGTHAWSEEALEAAAPDLKRAAMLKRERARSVGTSIRLEQDTLR